MQRIVVDVNDLIKGDSLLSDCIVHSQDVKSAVGNLADIYGDNTIIYIVNYMEVDFC